MELPWPPSSDYPTLAEAWLICQLCLGEDDGTDGLSLLDTGTER